MLWIEILVTRRDANPSRSKSCNASSSGPTKKEDPASQNAPASAKRCNSVDDSGDLRVDKEHTIHKNEHVLLNAAYALKHVPTRLHPIFHFLIQIQRKRIPSISQVTKQHQLCSLFLNHTTRKCFLIRHQKAMLRGSSLMAECSC